MFLPLVLIATFSLWLIDRLGYAQFTVHEIFYPVYGLGVVILLQILLAILSILVFGSRAKINIKW